MSKIGKQSIKIPESVEFNVGSENVSVKGPKGELSIPAFNDMRINHSDSMVSVAPVSLEARGVKARWGLFRSLLNNMVKGVTDGFVKRLEIHGVGYKARLDGSILILSLGFSHEIMYPLPDNVDIECLKNNVIEIRGCDKQLVSQVAADIRMLRPPEPYKLKGIRYEGEILVKKAGKKK